MIICCAIIDCIEKMLGIEVVARVLIRTIWGVTLLAHIKVRHCHTFITNSLHVSSAEITKRIMFYYRLGYCHRGEVSAPIDRHLHKSARSTCCLIGSTIDRPRHPESRFLAVTHISRN